MKTRMKIFAVLIILFMSTSLTSQKASAQPMVSFQLFYDQLSPYGSWVNYPSYGYAWIPSAGAGFTPYGTAGHWVFSTYGWTWVSDYPWGWAPFHYGRWYFDPMYGWIWIPDTEWGPAWVVWRSNPGYYGWAPLRPGVSINISFGPSYNVPNDWWVFVPNKYIASPNVYNYYAPRGNNVTIINNTTVINKTYSDNSRHATYVYGPDREDVQKVTGTTIKPVAIRETDKPGQSLSNGELKIYRPQVQKTTPSGQKPAPRNVVNLKDVKQVNPKNANNADRVAPNQKGKQQPAQQRTAPSNTKKEQPAPTRTVNPSEKKQSQEPPRTISPSKNEQPEPRKVNPEDGRDQPNNATPPVERQEQPQAQPRNVTPQNDNREPPQQIQNEKREDAPAPQRVAPADHTKQVPEKAPAKEKKKRDRPK